MNSQELFEQNKFLSLYVTPKLVSASFILKYIDNYNSDLQTKKPGRFLPGFKYIHRK
jgi:hypothetical protein